MKLRRREFYVGRRHFGIWKINRCLREFHGERPLRKLKVSGKLQNGKYKQPRSLTVVSSRLSVQAPALLRTGVETLSARKVSSTMHFLPCSGTNKALILKQA